MKRIPFLLIIILLLGGILRFYKLDWGDGFFFHPDEYHIARSVNQLNFPVQLNPNFFSYGSFSVYLIYFTKSIFSLESAFIVGRFISALFSTLTLVIIFKLTKLLLRRETYANLATFLVAISPGLIQQAHFATPESSLTFWIFLTTYFWTKWLKKSNTNYLIIAAVSFGIALGVKIIALVLVPILILLPFSDLKLKKNTLKKIGLVIFSLAISIGVFLLVYPYSILDWDSFLGSMKYETTVGRGSLPVFYTRQFTNTKPIVFQLTKILPFALGPILLLFGVLGFFQITLDVLNKRLNNKWTNINTPSLFVFSLLFFANSLLFAKWTRFIAPTFPFFAIFTVYFINKFTSKMNRSITKIITSTILVLTALWGLSFFSIYLKDDIRITSTNWINKSIPNSSFILTEAGNMLEVPLYGSIEKLSFDFYNLESKSSLQTQLPTLLERADYFIVQSRRIYTNHQRLPEQFPITSNFYDLLFTNQLGFEKIEEFSSFPKIEVGSWTWEVRDETAEETWTVFDHPVIRIYKKTNSFTADDYENLLKI